MISRNRFTNVAIDDTFTQLIIKQARKSIYFFKKEREESVLKMNNFSPKKGKYLLDNFVLQSLITKKNTQQTTKKKTVLRLHL